MFKKIEKDKVSAHRRSYKVVPIFPTRAKIRSVPFFQLLPPYVARHTLGYCWGYFGAHHGTEWKATPGGAPLSPGH